MKLCNHVIILILTENYISQTSDCHQSAWVQDGQGILAFGVSVWNMYYATHGKAG